MQWGGAGKGLPGDLGWESVTFHQEMAGGPSSRQRRVWAGEQKAWCYSWKGAVKVSKGCEELREGFGVGNGLGVLPTALLKRRGLGLSDREHTAEPGSGLTSQAGACSVSQLPPGNGCGAVLLLCWKTTAGARATAESERKPRAAAGLDKGCQSQGWLRKTRAGNHLLYGTSCLKAQLRNSG